ncbi:PDZ domain-containing protein [Rubinisphaera sp.]|uniref:PDZ domain-containing protein n=1 Tax=Rubinisphaera sp. TaxID=2024857 RepID=UPI000C0F15AA|nr:PDZ domain-containing protein [Rubinisphaera sp.]MBV10333.1 hypothetical protein [Rubinisphaera sp.]HCS52457.1 hypothetical protein [Planctomycetaceae bacterium]|tara:strand:- start:1359 stop:2384 length:1026 start_codon:yes stop_codon:yes gene_type:complete
MSDRVMLRDFSFAVLIMAMCLIPNSVVLAEEALDSSYSRHGEQLKLAFRDIVAQAPHLAIEIEINESIAIPGTLIDAKRGICVTKASSLEEYVSEADMFRCHLPGDRWVAANFLGYDKAQDMIFISCKRPSKLNLPEVKTAEELQAGQWVVSLKYAEELPMGIGVLGALPREILSSEGYVGLTVDQSEEGLMVKDVYANSGASRAGLKSGDIILSEANKPLQKRNRLSKLFAEYEPGDWFTLNALRDGELMSFDVRVGTSWDSVIDRQAMMNRFGSDVSARRSGFRSVLQHDTLLHPDHCGGPIINLEGELVGINIARAGRTDTLAVPIEDVLAKMKELLE